MAHEVIVSPVTLVQFVTDRLLHIILYKETVVLNVHAPAGDDVMANEEPRSVNLCDIGPMHINTMLQ
jgi:hypothetical protein